MLSVFGVIYGVLYWLPRWLSGNKSTCQCRKHRFNPWAGLIPGLGRSLGGRNGNPIQYSCLDNPMDRGTWRATVQRITKSWTWLSTHKWGIVFCILFNTNNLIHRIIVLSSFLKNFLFLLYFTSQYCIGFAIFFKMRKSRFWE